MRETIDLNNDWLYTQHFTPELCLPEYDENLLQHVRLPHTNIETPFHYFDESVYQFVSGYRRTIAAPEKWKGKTIRLTFDGAAHQATIYLNGTKIKTHKCGYTAFSMDISSQLTYGAPNLLVVELDSRESLNQPPFGGVIDYLTYGGLYREARIEVLNPLYIQDVFITTPESGLPDKLLCLEYTLSEEQAGLSLCHSVTDADGNQLAYFIQAASGKHAETQFAVTGAKLWDTDDPALYFLTTTLLKEEQPVDEIVTRFGFRSCRFEPEGFFLNGKPLKLRGLNRHQSYPYVGYAMPKGPQQNDAALLKQELGLNAVRTSHYPQSQHFIDRCDELGLLVFTEIPGWQHIGDIQWKEIACQTVTEMVKQYRNHPSIILWGVRINESMDDDEFYQQTNSIAHRLDNSRQTGGVRFIPKSHLLEDVYTYNDFFHNGITPPLNAKANVTGKEEVPYLISEYNGHMYPTKSFDDEAHRLEHALRHIRVLDAMYGADGTAGCFGWCMFDYNTHKDFGSGDRVCYHGVMDMFRNHKMAAAAYASQSSGNSYLTTSSTMDIGEHAASSIGPMYAFTNADKVRVYKNETLIGEFAPDALHFPHLPHPPVLIDDFIGDALVTEEGFSKRTAAQIKEILALVSKHGELNLPLKYKLRMGRILFTHRMNMADAARLYSKYYANWGGTMTTYRFDAIQKETVIASVRRSSVTQLQLFAHADRTSLTDSATYDVACIRIQAVDQNGNLVPYFQQPVRISTEGPVQLIGPSVFSLQGGMGGAYIKTTGVAGVAKLIITSEQTGEFSLNFTIHT